MSDTYVSIDVETTGPACPPLYSMISLGAAAFSRDGEELGTWSANLKELPEAGRHPDTMAWWNERPDQWVEARRDTNDPLGAMLSFDDWLGRLPGHKIAAAWPAAFDFAWVSWYCHQFLSRNPLGYACLDIRSLAMGLTYSRGYHDLREGQIRALRGWVDREGLTEHVALDDAVEQGRLLAAMLSLTKGGEVTNRRTVEALVGEVRGDG